MNGIKSIVLTGLILAQSLNVSAENHLRSLRQNELRSFDGYVSRIESLTYIKSNDTLWQANDKIKTAGSIDVFTHDPKQIISNRYEFFLPLAEKEKDISIKNYEEVETIASDGGNVLYMVNTVNDPDKCGEAGKDIEDIATIYKLERPSANASFKVTDYKILPSASKCPDTYNPVSSYSAMVVIDGEIYFGSSYNIYLYSFDENEFVTPDQQALITLRENKYIRDMSYENGYLWVLSYNDGETFLAKYHWKSRTLLETYKTERLLSTPRGLAVHNDEIFIGENASTSPNIHVFKEPVEPALFNIGAF